MGGWPPNWLRLHIDRHCQLLGTCADSRLLAGPCKIERVELLNDPRFHILLPLVLLAVALASVAVMSCASRTTWAQAQLTLSDFDRTGLQMEMLALIEAGADDPWWARDRFGSQGTLVDGDLSIQHTADNIIRVRGYNSGANITINHDAAVDLTFSTYFGEGGDGRDLTLYIRIRRRARRRPCRWPTPSGIPEGPTPPSMCPRKAKAWSTGSSRGSGSSWPWLGRSPIAPPASTARLRPGR